MLTVAAVAFALQIVASASPVDREPRGIVIPLARRVLVNETLLDNIFNAANTNTQTIYTLKKYKYGFQAYAQNTGKEHPLLEGASIDTLDKDIVGLIDQTSLVQRDTGSESLTDDDNGALWQGTISVGTPPHTYTVDFDTGSSDLFLPSSNCRSSACSGHSTYNPTKSSTSADRHKSYTLRYGDGTSVSGEQYTDTVAVACLMATKQTLGASTKYSGGFSKSQFPPDGLMGMGYQSISAYNTPSVFQSLVAQGETTHPVFAFNLARSNSELFLGGVDSTLYSGSFTYTPVTVQGYWQVMMDSIMGGNNGAGPKHIPSVIDTGTSLIIGDSATVRAFYRTIPGAKDASSIVGPGYYTVPCSSVPTVKLSFGGKAFSIDPDLFNLGLANRGSKDCVGGIVGLSGVSFWIIGDLFLQNVYTSFDMGNNRVGFANLK